MINKYQLILFLILICFIGCTGNSSDHQYTGILEGTSVQVPALTPGKILDIFVDAGESVQKEQLLAVIDSTDLIFQLEQLQATSEELKIQAEIAKTNLLRAQKDYDYIKTKHERIASLYKTESVTKQQLDDITNNLQNAQTAVANTRQTQGSINAKSKQIDAKIKSVSKKIKDARIISPINGIITSIYFEKGEAIPMYGPLLEIIDISTMEVKIYISEELLPQVKYDQEVSVMVDGLDRTLSGKIIWISPKAEFTPKTILTPDTRTSLVYAVKVSITNENGILKHGMPVVINL